MNREPTHNSSTPFPDEAAHLAETMEQLDQALAEAEADVGRIDREYRAAKRYMAEYRGEIDPHEMFQNELLLKQTDRTGNFAMGIRDRLVRLKESPYFARIDFCEMTEADVTNHPGEDPAVFYIGRFAFNHRGKLLIYDWRAPVAGMFYDCEVGPAGYDAPMGRIDGELIRKRQFRIKDGIMEYTLESFDNVQDEVLQKELSHTSDEKMKSIIATIQKEQNRIIRNENKGTLIIQGVAGSGKTSIALHRIAFLLYRFRDRLSARNVTILSPNKVFADYISNVIPELGEEPIYEMSFLDIAEIQLEGVIGFEADRDPVEAPDERWRKRSEFKSTREFVALMDEYIGRLPDRIFQPVDYTFGRFRIDREWIGKRFCAYGSYPVRKRIPMVAEDICQRLESENIREDDLPAMKTVVQSLTAMLTVRNPLALYKDFFQTIERPGLFVMPGRKLLEWADVYPFLYLYAAFEGLKESRLTRHLVIDEMQDYTPVQYAVINRLFPCSKTILGDYGQFLNPCHVYGLADLKQIYAGAEFIELNKSYRSTCEIMNFAKKVGGIDSLEAMERHGELPVLAACKDEAEELRQIREMISGFAGKGSSSLGMILKTDKAAKELYDLLAGEYEVNLISPESTDYAGGISIASVRMAKGLEFDEVLVPQANDRTYCSDYDRSLLYIACTRAMHRLTLSYVGELSRFVKTEMLEKDE